MNIDKSQIHHQFEPSDEKSRVRKPYHTPAFRFERVFETRALSCGKVSSTQQACSHNRKTS
jgi:hypothetical protein